MINISPENLKQRIKKRLPGLKSHLKMAPASRVAEIVSQHGNYDNAKKSAVMILLFHENDKMKVVFIRRSFYVGIHAGQIAFPGGRYEESDVSVQNTALREIEEEIGINADKIEILGQLTDIYVPPSNFLISVFVGYLKLRPVYKIDEREVAEIIEIDLKEFFVDDVIQEKEFVVPSTNTSVNTLYYKAGNIDLWGASAMVMSELIDLIKE